MASREWVYQRRETWCLIAGLNIPLYQRGVTLASILKCWQGSGSHKPCDLKDFWGFELEAMSW